MSADLDDLHGALVTMMVPVDVTLLTPEDALRYEGSQATLRIVCAVIGGMKKANADEAAETAGHPSAFPPLRLVTELPSRLDLLPRGACES